MNIETLKARQVYEQELADEMLVNSAVSVEDHAYQLGRVMMLNDLIRDLLHGELAAILAPVESAVSPELETVELAIAQEESDPLNTSAADYDRWWKAAAVCSEIAKGDAS